MDQKTDLGELAIRVAMMPRDTNGAGTIFGGVILSYIDTAGAIEARKVACTKIVTVALHEVVFVSPVFVGDIVSFYASVIKTGRTSITVKVLVEAERWAKCGERVRVTEAEVVYVAIGPDGKPVPVAEFK
jgi:acyl-CoA thioesterase YciA